MDPTKNKRPFLFAQDYGMGGIWIYVFAQTPSDVVKKYPGLKYITSKPAWLIDYEKNNQLLRYDIDDNDEILEAFRKQA